MGHKPWEPWQIELLQNEYGKTSTEDLAEKIGKKRQAIIQYAHKHGISSGRFFTESEIEYIETHFGNKTSAVIAKNLGRDVHAVRSKIYQMGLGPYCMNSDRLNLRQVCDLVGRDKETIKDVWFKNGLKYVKKGKYTMIEEKDLLKFMEENPKYWNAVDCEAYFFQRFEWFREKHKVDFQNMVNSRWNINTKEKVAR